MKQLIKFIGGIFSSGTPESGKRVFGAIGYIVALWVISNYHQELINQVLYISAGLLGLESLTNGIEKLINKK